MSMGEPSAEESHAFIAYLKGLPDAPELVRFFDRGGYFTVHQRDAVSIAQEYFKTNAVIKYMHARGARPGADPREGGTPYVTVSRAMTTTILRSLLLERRKRVEVYRLNGREWVLARRGSPGNLSAFEDELLRDASVPATSVTIAVRLGPPVVSGQRRVGVALADPTQRWLRVAELSDDEQVRVGLGSAMAAAAARAALPLAARASPLARTRLICRLDLRTPYFRSPAYTQITKR